MAGRGERRDRQRVACAVGGPLMGQKHVEEDGVGFEALAESDGDTALGPTLAAPSARSSLAPAGRSTDVEADQLAVVGGCCCPAGRYY